MCTNIAAKLPLSGSAKGAEGWFSLEQAYVSYDHPVHAPLVHALNLDFVNEAAGMGTRVAVELTRESAAALAHSILAALEEGKDHA